MTDRIKAKLEGYKHKCPVCGSEFWAFADWKYRKHVPGKRNKEYYCSWKCIRKTEKVNDDAIDRRKVSSGSKDGSERR